jgi:hypothetical protein
MKYILVLISIQFSFSIIGQRKINSADTLKISGTIKNELSFTLMDLDTFAKIAINEFVLTNQNGEIKKKNRNLKRDFSQEYS